MFANEAYLLAQPTRLSQSCDQLILKYGAASKGNLMADNLGLMKVSAR